MKDKPKVKSLLLDLIDKYKICYRDYKKILELTEQQKENIITKELTDLTKVTNKKQRIIDKIDQEQKEIDLIRRQLSDKLNIVNDKEFINNLLKVDIPYKDKIEKVSYQILKLVSKLQKLDEKNYELLEKRKDKWKKKLSQLNEGKKAFNSYMSGNKVNREGKFFDSKR
ncbi:hypothetical protein JCM16358_19250 [Halanaerocella petrolearia]